MRQKGDFRFTELLNRLRENKLTPEDKELIYQRIITPHSPMYPKHAPHLFIENKFVDAFNENLLDSLTTQKAIVKADTDILSQTKLSNEIKLRLIQNLPENQANTGQLKTNLLIAVDMIYDISLNLDVADGLTNGATCVVKHIEYRTSQCRPAIIWVLFKDPKIGISRRNQYRHLFSSRVDGTWTPIFEVKRTFIFNKKTYERVQFPLQASAGKTIHKAQGATLSNAVINLTQTKQRKIPHIHYVALSRVKSLDGLFILDFNEKSLDKDDSVDEEMDRLRQKKIQLCYQPLYTLDKDVKFIFNNARSLHKHIDDVKADPNVLSADVVGIAESWLSDSDLDETFLVDGFRMFRNDGKSSHCSRSHHGIVLYLKPHLTVLSYNSFCSESVEFSFVSVQISDSEVQFVVFYKKPSCSLQLVCDTIEKRLLPLMNRNAKSIIMGDFNFNISNECNGNFLKFMKEKCSCNQVMNKMTTKYKTQVDLVFTDFPDVQTEVLEAYWSDHNMIYCATDLV